MREDSFRFGFCEIALTIPAIPLLYYLVFAFLANRSEIPYSQVQSTIGRNGLSHEFSGIPQFRQGDPEFPPVVFIQMSTKVNGGMIK